MDQEEIEFDNVTICAHCDFKDGEHLLSILESIREIEMPRSFENQLVDIDLERLLTSQIAFGASGPLSPVEAETNNILINVEEHEGKEDTEEKNRLHIHSYSDKDHFEAVDKILYKIIEAAGPYEIDIRTVESRFPVRIQDLKIPIEEGTDFNVNGIRLTEGRDSYLLQEIPGEEELYVRYHSGDQFTINEEDTGNLTASTSKEAIDFIEKLYK